MARVFRLLLLAALLGGLFAGVSGVEPVRAYPGSHVNLTGHGWGHGRGMGQYGAQGYATLHGWSYTQILDHYYGGTAMGTVGNDVLSVRITRKDNAGVIVRNAAEFGGPGAVYIERVAPNSFRVQSGPGCGGPWTLVHTQAGPVNLHPRPGTLLELCDVPANVSYHGSLQVKDHDGSKLVNYVDTEGYVRGVVPRESPSWFDADALQAQAVAARSYARAFARDAPYADQCDTIRCQVYGGASGETGPTNAAVAATAGQVRRHTSNGAVASTEFSSSTGGYTAGGTFPAVPDLGDTVSSNPNHTWKTSVPVSAVEAEYPQIGTLLAVSITKRNGHGEWGGRVLEMVLRGSSGSKTISGDTFRSKFGLKSNWFNLCDASGGVDGYWVAAPDGGIFAFGKAEFFGSMGGTRLNRPVVGMASSPDSKGYWLVASDGGIFSFGSARFHGSTGNIRLNQPVVGMAPTKDGGGYWLVASDGGIFAFGNARFHGSMGGTRLNQPVVGMAATPTGDGYWLVASDGGIFAFGDARFHGSMGGTRLNQSVTAMAATSDGGGYWMIGRDGGIFAFGNAPFFGSLPALREPGPAEAIRGTYTDGGYAMATSDGRVFTFGDAPYCGDVAGAVPGYRGGVEGFELRRAT